MSPDLLEFFRLKLSSHPLTKSLYLLLHQVVLFTNFNANVDLAMWVELIRDLGDRMKQHVPSVIRNKIQLSRQQPERQCRSNHFISCESAVSKHLLSNKSCAETYPDGNFRILYKCRSAFQLKVMEAICIKLNDPDVSRQMEFVFQLALFWPSRTPSGWCHQFLRLYMQVICFFWVSRRIALDKWSAEMHRALS